MNMPHLPIVEQIMETNEQRRRTKSSVFALLLVACAVAFASGALVGMALMTWGPR